ncbi:hypothetical protein BKA62DRAFT_148300 [Auriculariales sp. MPI-PUGE-AT-0066]|nr:hypothetical protein BKA62DRAFT_148300 [Auriculariales sp. MPI-PUGE-AT-0066]
MSINAILAAVTDRGNDAGSAQASTSNNHHVAATAQSLSPVHPHHPIEGSPASSESSRMERARQEASQEVSGLKTPTRPKLSISTTSSNSANALDMLANVCGTMPLSAIPTSATTSTPFPRPCRKLTTDENDSVLQVARKELGYLEDRLDSMSTSDRRPLSQLLQDEPPTSPDAVDGPLGITYTNSSQEGDGDAKDLPSRHPQHSPSPPAMRNATRKRQKIVDSDEESLASALLGDSVTDDKKVKQEVPSQPAKKALPSFKKKNQAGSAVKGEDSVKSSQESDRPRGREKTKERKEQVSKPAPVGPSSLPTRPQANGLPPKPSAASAAVALRPGERPLPPEKSSADVDVASFMQSFMHAGSSGPGAAAAASASREAERAEIEARKKAALEAREAEYVRCSLTIVCSAHAALNYRQKRRHYACSARCRQCCDTSTCSWIGALTCRHASSAHTSSSGGRKSIITGGSGTTRSGRRSDVLRWLRRGSRQE